MPVATLISAVPTFSSRSEHNALIGSTPASFHDIPPVLHHQEENVSVIMCPPLNGFPPQTDKQGTLYIIESALVFISASGHGFEVKYPSITLHAISRSGSSPSIYCQLDERAGDAEDDLAREGDYETRELIIIPERDSALELIFDALSQCSSLHPDKDIANDDMDDAFISASIDLDDAGDMALSDVERSHGKNVNNNRYAPY